MPKNLLRNTKSTVSISEAANILGVSIDTVRRWDKLGKLHSQRTDGKNRYFSIEELESLKISKPLSIGQATQTLGISPSTLRRLEKRGLLVPKRDLNGERVYEKDVIEKFLESDYFLRKKEIQEKVLEPFKKVKKEVESLETPHENITHKILGAEVVEVKDKVTSLVRFKNFFVGSGSAVLAFSLIAISIITSLFFMFPEKTGSYFGYREVVYETVPTQTPVLGASDSRVGFISGRVLASIFKPFGDASLEIVKNISPETYKKVVPVEVVQINDPKVLTVNAEYVDGKKPGTSAGDLVILNNQGLISSSLLPDYPEYQEFELTEGIINSNFIENGTIKEEDLAFSLPSSSNGDITSVTIGTGLSGGGTQGDVSISLTDACSDGELLKWNDSLSVWECGTDNNSGGSGGSVDIQENDSNVTLGAAVIDFLGSDFIVSNSPSGEANVSIDYSNSKIVRIDSTETLTNKTISGSSNTLTNIPNSALTNSSLTVSAGTGLAGGGVVSLGGSISLSSTLGTSIDISDETNLVASDGITLTGDTLTNTDKGSNQNIFKTIAVSGQSDVLTDSNNDTLTLAAGSNITITTNDLTDTITIAATDTNTTYSAGNDLDLTGTTFDIESVLDFVSTINLAGTGTLNGLDVIDGTSETTIESAIDTLSNLTSATSLSSVGTLTSGSTGTGFTLNFTNSTLSGNVTGANISGIDISDDTNLSATGGIVLTGDELSSTLGTSIANSEIDNDAIDFDKITDNLTLDAQTTITAESSLSLRVGNNVSLNTTGTGTIVATDLSCTDCIGSTEISGLTWAELSGTPTTLSGYGITDGLSTTTSFSGDVGGNYNSLTLGSNTVDDSELVDSLTYTGALSVGNLTISDTNIPLTGSSLTFDFNNVSDRTLTIANSGAGTSNLVVDGTISASNFSGTSSGTNTGDQTITLTGDVTGSGTGSFATTIAGDSVALTTDTTGNYVQSIANGSGISGGNGGGEGSALTLSLGELTSDWTQSGAFDILLSNASSELKIKESSGDTYYGILEVGDLGSADATYTFSGTSGTVLTSANVSGALSGWDQDSSDDLTTSNYSGTLDSQYVNIGESPAAGDISGSFSGGLTIGANSVALTTDTTGNYVQSLATSVLTGLTGGASGSEGAVLTLALDYSQSLSGNVGLVGDAAVFGVSGLIFEGSSADNIETFISVTNPTGSDKTITFPDSSGTVILSGGTFTGDVTATLDTDGSTALTIAADSVALGTDTTGNYVASFTAGDGLTGDGSGEGSTPTIAISTGNGIQISSDAVALGALTGTWDQTGAFDIQLNNSSSELKILESGGTPTLFGILDVGDLSSSDSTYTFSGASGTVLTSANVASALSVWDQDSSNDLTTSTSFSGDLTGNYNSLSLGSNVVDDSELVDALTYTGAFSVGNLTISDTNVPLTGSSFTFDFNTANDRTFTITNSNGSNVANLSVEGDTSTATVTVGGDTIDEFVGTGLTLSSGDLQTTLGTSISNSELDNDTVNFDKIASSLTLDEETTIAAGSALNLLIGNNVTLTTTGGGLLIATDLSCTDCIGSTEIADLALGTDTSGNYVATITGGAGLTGSGSSEGSTPTLAVGAGTGITVNADDIAVNQVTNFAWTGIQTHTNTITDSGAQSTFTLTLGDDGGVDTVSAIQIDVTSTATGDTDNLYGLSISNITGQANVIETAINIGTGWEQAINAGGTLLSLSELQLLDDGIALSELTDSGTLTATTVDINGGNIDGTAIGASSASTASFTTLSSTGATTIGNNSSTVAINSNDWDIDATGALTGISFDANGTGNSITNIENADFASDTITLTAVADTLTLDGANLTLASSDSTNDYKIVFDNSSTGDVATLLQVTTSGSGSTIGTALDVSDGDIGVAIAVGTNDITVGGATLSSSEVALLDSGIALSELIDSGTLTATTVDINGGNIDGTAIGSSSRSTALFTTLGTNGNATLGDANSDTLTINAGSSGTGIAFGDSSFANCTALETISGVLTCGSDDGGGGSLDAAYNGGGTVTVDAYDVLFDLSDSSNDYGIVIDNNTAGAIAIGLEFTSGGGGALTVAIDVSATEIGTAIAIGNNDITVGGVTISSAEFALIDSGVTYSELTDSGTLTATTVDINGGNIDGTVLGATTPADATVTGLTVTTGALAVNSDSITSDGATLTINAGGNVSIQDALAISGGLTGVTTLSSSGDWTWSATTPTITVNTDETFTISDAGGAFNFSVATGPNYTGDARPSKTITLSPEFAGGVLTAFYGAGTDTNTTGIMTSEVDTSGNAFRTYYSWSRSQATQHFQTIAVRITLPQDFSAWAPSNAFQVDYKTGSATEGNSEAEVYIYNSSSATQVTSVTTGTASTSWATQTIDDSVLDAGNSQDIDAAGETMVVYLRLGSQSGNAVQIGDIKLNYLGRF